MDCIWEITLGGTSGTIHSAGTVISATNLNQSSNRSFGGEIKVGGDNSTCLGAVVVSTLMTTAYDTLTVEFEDSVLFPEHEGFCVLAKPASAGICAITTIFFEHAGGPSSGH